MTKIYSYLLRYDDGAAPNPFWGSCTLTICKPAIRRKVSVGDWVIGTGSKNAECNDGKIYDLSKHIVYAMRITKTMPMETYDSYCQLQLSEKIPDVEHPDWRRRMGDCIYYYDGTGEPMMRPGVHSEDNRFNDLNGINALLSDHFYYFGENAVSIPDDLLVLIKRLQGHKIIQQRDLIKKFESWIGQFTLNEITGEPQLKHLFDKENDEIRLTCCGSCHLADDQNETTEKLC